MLDVMVADTTNSDSNGYRENEQTTTPKIVRVVTAEIAETVKAKVNSLELDVKQSVLGQAGFSLKIDGQPSRKLRKVVLTGEIGKPWTVEIHEFLI